MLSVGDVCRVVCHHSEDRPTCPPSSLRSQVGRSDSGEVAPRGAPSDSGRWRLEGVKGFASGSSASFDFSLSSARPVEFLLPKYTAARQEPDSQTVTTRDAKRQGLKAVNRGAPSSSCGQPGLLSLLGGFIFCICWSLRIQGRSQSEERNN